jgi:omega-6 fatty acid desaturase (delta-12 desaturase)
MKALPISVTQGRNWRQILSAYQQPVLWRSIVEIVITAAPLVATWVGAWFAVAFGYWWLGLLLAPLAAAFVVRLFMVQHDCSHQSFFKSAAANNWTGRIVGALTLTPYHCWRRSHALHHASSGNLDRRGIGDIKTLTTAEYQALGFWGRLGYRAFRHPLVLFVIGPAWVFLIEQRLPMGLMREGWKPWLSAMGTNAVVGVLVIAAIWLGGWKALLLVHLPTMVIAASIGVWLFYVQHQFEETYWARREAWEPVDAALQGSSHYDLPEPLRWMTASIGVHHVHHVSSKIPFYRLNRVLKDNPELRAVSRLTLKDSVRCVALTLWDEEERRLVSFRQFHRKERALARA